jgi:hypothetical protein
MKDYGVYLLLNLDNQPQVIDFINFFNERTKTDVKLAGIWKRTYCEIVSNKKKSLNKVQVLIRLEPHIRFTRFILPHKVSIAAEEGLKKACYTGSFESCQDKKKIKELADKYIFGV